MSLRTIIGLNTAQRTSFLRTDLIVCMTLYVYIETILSRIGRVIHYYGSTLCGYTDYCGVLLLYVRWSLYIYAVSYVLLYMGVSYVATLIIV